MFQKSSNWWQHLSEPTRFCCSPVNYSRPMQVLHRHDQLAYVFLRVPLFQSFLLVDVVHEVSAGAELHHEVVAVLRLQDVQKLGDVRVADHLLDLTFTPQVLGDVRVLFGLPLVDYFHRHLWEDRQWRRPLRSPPLRKGQTMTDLKEPRDAGTKSRRETRGECLTVSLCRTLYE